jgi:hypothetical protein
MACSLEFLHLEGPKGRLEYRRGLHWRDIGSTLPYQLFVSLMCGSWYDATLITPGETRTGDGIDLED